STTSHDLIAAKAAEYFAAHRAGPPSASEAEQFMRWLRESPVHVAEYLAISQLSRDLSKELGAWDISLDEVIAEAHSEADNVLYIGGEPIDRRPRPTLERWRNRIALSGFAAVAAGIIIL